MGFLTSILLQNIKYEEEFLETKNLRGKKSHKVEAGSRTVPKKKRRGDHSALEWFEFHVRGFGCVQNQALSTDGTSA